MFTSGSWKVKPGKEQEFIDTWTAFANATSEKTPGWVGYAYLLRDASDPSYFTTLGEWADIESINAWRQSSGFKSFMKKFDALCESRHITTFEMIARIGRHQAVSG